MNRLQDIELSDRDRRVIETAAKLLYERFPVQQVVLFGSKARGDDEPHSDIDLLILTKREMNRREKGDIIEALYELELEHDVLMNPLIIQGEQWWHGVYQVLPIRHEIDREGVAA